MDLSEIRNTQRLLFERAVTALASEPAAELLRKLLPQEIVTNSPPKEHPIILAVRNFKGGINAAQIGAMIGTHMPGLQEAFKQKLRDNHPDYEKYAALITYAESIIRDAPNMPLPSPKSQIMGP